MSKDRVVVITGATGGLGRVVAHHLAKAGARLVLVSSNDEKLKALERELNVTEGRIFSIAADLSQPEAAQSLLDSVVGKFGCADVLLHFVGGWTGGKPVDQVSAEEMSIMLQQHLWTTFFLARVFSPHMKANGWGRLIVISSPSAAAPSANGASYAVGKSAQEALMLALAEEFKGTDVTANIIRVRTIDVKHERDNQATPKKASWTTPEEIAAAIDYLITDNARMVNGARIPLYGSQ
ncbi:MAG: SDR family oxidoreductase [Chloroflexi bacterium]|nr:MAG: SDR family oxidoreductase [Chloroflexota bacterium]